MSVSGPSPTPQQPSNTPPAAFEKGATQGVQLSAQEEQEIEKLIPKYVQQIKEAKAKNPDIGIKLSYIFYLLLDAMNVKQGALQNTAKELGLNSDSQDKLNNMLLKLKYPTLDPTKAESGSDQQREDYRTQTQNMIKQMEDVKSTFQSMVSTLSQKAKGTMSDASSEASGVQQDSDQASGLARLLQKMVSLVTKEGRG